MRQLKIQEVAGIDAHPSPPQTNTRRRQPAQPLRQAWIHDRQRR
jgi:hypothetical protein